MVPSPASLGGSCSGCLRVVIFVVLVIILAVVDDVAGGGPGCKDQEGRVTCGTPPPRLAARQPKPMSNFLGRYSAAVQRYTVIQWRGRGSMRVQGGRKTNRPVAKQSLKQYSKHTFPNNNTDGKEREWVDSVPEVPGVLPRPPLGARYFTHMLRECPL